MAGSVDQGEDVCEYDPAAGDEWLYGADRQFIGFAFRELFDRVVYDGLDESELCDGGDPV